MTDFDHWLLPEGIEDVLPADARRLEQMRRNLLDHFETWGYELVLPPFIEFLDSLLTGTGRDLDLQTFKLTDQVSGRMLGIRADMTPQVARIDARNLKKNAPARLCYIGTVLHTRGDPLEKSRSPLQVGAELYGHSGVESDLEIIQLMLESLQVTGIQNIHIDLGHVGIFRALARDAGLTPEREKAVFDVMQRKAIPQLGTLLNSYGLKGPLHDMLFELPKLNGGPEVIDRARSVLAPAGPEVMRAIDYLQTVQQSLARSSEGLPVNYDLAELRGYNYQTGIVFAAFVPGYGREIARGGRYDEIGSIFGRARPATGFSADLKVLTGLGPVSAAQPEESIFAPATDNVGLQNEIRRLRSEGRRVIQQLPGQVGDAAECGCNWRLEPGSGEWRLVRL